MNSERVAGNTEKRQRGEDECSRRGEKRPSSLWYALYCNVRYFAIFFHGIERKVSWYHFSSTIKKVENAFANLFQSLCNKTLMFLCLWIKTIMPGKISQRYAVPISPPLLVLKIKISKEAPQVLVMGIFWLFSMNFQCVPCCGRFRCVWLPKKNKIK